ncbi:hypothetical protein [Lacinutrix salivirga]
MRKIILSLLCLFVLSCSSDDDSNNDSTPAIVGTWVISQFNLENDAFDLNGDGTESNELISESGCYQGETIVFNANGTGSLTFTTDLDLKLTIQNNVETFSDECLTDNANFNFTWSQLDNGSFVADANGDAETITLLSNNTLSRSSFFEYEIEFLDGNGNVTSTAFSDSDATIVYTKQ